jgi:hypothetical protein
MLPSRRIPWALVLRDAVVWGFAAGLLTFVLAWLFLADLLSAALR